MLENLFAHAQQQQAFLCLTGCGFVLGAMVHLTGFVRRGRRLLGAMCDLACSAVLLVLLLMNLLRYGGGIRAYGLLGLMIGFVLYCAGVSRLVEALVALGAKLVKGFRKTSSPKEGFSSGGAEMITITEALRKE